MQVAIEEERPRISGAAFLPNQVFEKRSICSFLFDKTTRSIVILIVLVLCLGIVMLAAPNNVPANVIGGCFTLSGCYLVRRLLRHIRCYCKTPAVVLQLDSEGARYFKPSGTIDIPWTSIAGVLVREEHPWYGCTYIGVVELTFFQTTGLTRGMEFHSHGWEVQGGLAPVLAALMDHAPDPTVQPKFISGTSHKLEYCGGICRIEASRVVVNEYRWRHSAEDPVVSGTGALEAEARREVLALAMQRMDAMAQASTQEEVNAIALASTAAPVDDSMMGSSV